jgi:hypothetical protein
LKPIEIQHQRGLTPHHLPPLLHLLLRRRLLHQIPRKVAKNDEHRYKRDKSATNSAIRSTLRIKFMHVAQDKAASDITNSNSVH